MSKDASIGWMYEGAKGNVHREDYLLGKKVDKNFEKYSDVVNAQKEETIDTIVGTRTVFNSGTSTGLKTSSLQKDIIKSEDPFVAVKVREETKRREIMDNPLMKMRLQNMLKTMMTSKTEKKKEKKSKKDKKKRKKRRSRSSSSSGSDNDEESKNQKKRSPSPKRKRRMSERNEEAKNDRRRVSSGDRRKEDRIGRRSRSRSIGKDRNDRRKSRSPRRDRSRSKSSERVRNRSRSQKRHRSRSKSAERIRRKSRSPRRQISRSADKSVRSQRRSREEEKRKSRSRTRSRSRSADKPSSSTEKDSRQFDSHIPRHLQSRNHSSSSDSESDHEMRSRRKGSDDEKEGTRRKSYGLVEMRRRTAKEREEEARPPSKEYKLIKIPTGRGSNNKQREPRRVLTDEEKTARLAEMQDNVKWRDEVREKNVAKGKIEDDDEKEEADKNGYAPSFIRSQMREACDDLTVEKRLQSNKKGVQRTHGYMDRNFARK